MNNQQLFASITNFLKAENWEPLDNGHPLVLWQSTDHEESITLPSEQFIDHRQADFIFKESLETLAQLYDMSEAELIQNLHRCLNNVDVFSFRTIGAAIEHGKINLSQGAKTITAIDGLVKFAAKNFITSKKDKSKIVQEYLASTSLAVPGAGSFIHNIEIDLGHSKDSANQTDNDVEKINRYVNTRLANLLSNIQDLSDKDLSPSVLVEKGINPTICRLFIELFSEDVEEIECDFHWSLLEAEPKIKTNKVIFNRSHKEKMVKIQASFQGSEDFHLVNIAAHIESYKTQQGKEPVVELRLKVDGSERTCDAIIPDKTMQDLMAGVSKRENLNQLVTVTATVTKVVEHSKPSYHITLLKEISLDKEQTISIPF